MDQQTATVIPALTPPWPGRAPVAARTSAWLARGRADGARLEALPHGRSILHVPGGSVIGHYGVVLTPDGHLIADQTINAKQLLRIHELFIQRALHRTRQRRGPTLELHGRVLCLTSDWSRGYYDWLLEIFPRLMLPLKAKIPFDVVVISSEAIRPFHTETLRRAGVEPHQVVRCGPVDVIRADHLFVPSFPSRRGAPALDVIEWVRTLFPVAHEPRECLYWARSRHGNDRLVNEDDLLPILRAHGYQIVYPGDLSVEEQARVVGRARVLFSVHGAGLANMIFLSPGASVVEVLPAGLPCDDLCVRLYRELAGRLGLNVISREWAVLEEGEVMRAQAPVRLPLRGLIELLADVDNVAGSS